jgi:hypothetical protein
MVDREELIRRKLDRELDKATEEQIQRLTAEDPAFAAALARAEALQRELGQLPPPEDPGPALTQSIMAALPPRPGRSWSLWVSHPVPVPAWAIALVAVVAVVAFLWVSWQPSPPPSVATVAPAGKTRCEPQVVLVRFMLQSPAARTVSLAGDFNGWSLKRTPLTDPDGDGTWTVTLPLRPGRYQYKFLVDGQRWTVDPGAPTHLPDGFGGQNSLLVL